MAGLTQIIIARNRLVKKKVPRLFLSSANNFDEKEDFLVHDFSFLLSDAHCPISLELNVQCHLKYRNKPVKRNA